jgi:hypothetical protein
MATPVFVYLMLRPFLVVRTEMAESAATGEKQVHCNAFTCVFVYLMLYLLFVVCTDVAISEVMLEDAHADLISNQGPENHVRCKKMTYEELYLATEGFKEDLKLGEGGFGPVYKGFLDSTNQVGSHTSVQAKVFCYVSLYKNQTSTVVVFLYLQPNLINAVVDL